jgi:predicted branched-subunit amino acid permease
MSADCKCTKQQGMGTTGATLAAALLPKFGCPLCWPFYAALFSAVGVPLQSANRLLTLMTAALTIAIVIALVRNRDERSPAVLAVASALMVLAFRLFDLPRATCYAGSAGLVIALAWQAVSRALRQRALPLTEEKA